MKQLSSHWRIENDKIIFTYENYSGKITPRAEQIPIQNECEVVWEIRLDYPSDDYTRVFQTLEDAVQHILEEAEER